MCKIRLVFHLTSGNLIEDILDKIMQNLKPLSLYSWIL